MDHGEGTRREGHHDPQRRLQPVVPGHRPARRDGRLLAREGLHGDPPQRLRHLGEHAEGPGRHVQGDGPRERLLPPLHPHVVPLQGGGARGGLRQGVRRGHAPPPRRGPRGRRAPRPRERAGGAPRHPAHLRDRHVRHVLQVDQELPRPAAPPQPVGQRGAVGDAHAPLPAHHRVPLAGGPHGPRHPRGVVGRGHQDPRDLPPLRRGVDGGPRPHGGEDRRGEVRGGPEDHVHRGHDAGRQGAPGGHEPRPRARISPRPST